MAWLSLTLVEMQRMKQWVEDISANASLHFSVNFKKKQKKEEEERKNVVKSTRSTLPQHLLSFCMYLYGPLL